jgi:methylenetetrahydrofolate dehydrogenase (NADP+)/methenyltetrahydrofolate cyclohydrolase
LAATGIDHRASDLPVETSPEELVAHVRGLNEDPRVHGVLVLMPLPRHLPASLILEHLSPLKDVDGITPTNAGRLHLGLPSLRPSTPQGGIEIMDHYAVPIARQHIVVVDFGINVVRNEIVGDADAATVAEVAGAYTPVPGGTGPVTSVVLARNTVAAAFASLAGSLDEVEQIVPLGGAPGI